MKAPLVTIAIPVYNGGEFLRYAIQSIINQTYRDWELILINDGSTDLSLDVIRYFVEKYPNIKVINDGENRGLINRLNQSVGLARGKYYARMDADDIMAVSRIETQVNFLESNPEIDVVGSSIMIIDNNNHIVGSGYYYGIVHEFVHPTIMGKTNWFRNNPYSNWPNRAEDVELWLKTYLHSNFYAIEKPLLFYREVGVPALKKYLLSELTLLRIYLNFREYGKSFIWCIRGFTLAFIKIVVFSLFSLFGKTDFIIKKRRRTPVPIYLRLEEIDLNRSII